MLTYRYPKGYGQGLRVGTCSWKYDSWKGLVYDPGRSYRPADYLADYARFLNSVEVDQWFWSLFPPGVRLPERETVQAYADAVPEGFAFSVKAPNAITLTHVPVGKGSVGRSLGPPNPHFLSVDLLRTFLDRLSPLGPKLGPVMFQFEYLNKQKMSGPAEFLDRFDAFIRQAPPGPVYGLETRNPRYITPELFAFLRERKVAFVGLEGYYMPPLSEVLADHEPEPGSVLVLRLHGGDRKAVEAAAGERWDRIVSPRAEAVRAAARITRSALRKKCLVYLNVNNHFEGSAPLTIERLFGELDRDDA